MAARPVGELERLGNVEMWAGNLGRRASATQRDLRLPSAGRAGTGHSEWQRDLSGARQLGNVEVSAGNLGAARERYEADLRIAERLAAVEPGNSV